jgi:hypothetical protein
MNALGHRGLGKSDRSTDLGADARRPLTIKQINEISAWRTSPHR